MGPDGDLDWTDAVRIWPKPKRMIPWTIPDVVRSPAEEADRCFNAGAYSACAVMCGRALEGICMHYEAESKTLDQGLQELRNKDIIDKRLHQWGDELRKVRNLGAHATTERIGSEDAQDVLDFLRAIIDYVFVLNERFEHFMNRRTQQDAT